MQELARLRKKKGLSQIELGEALCLDGNSISRYERGIVKPSIEIANKIANFFDIPVDALLNGPQKNEWEIRVILEETDDWEVERMDLTNGSKNRFSVHIGPGKIGVEVSGRFDGPEDLDDVFSRARKCAEETLVAQGKLARI